MNKIPEWLIYALMCALLYGFWGFFGKLATKHIDYKTAFIYQAIGTILAILFILIPTKNLSFESNISGIIFGILVGICETVAALIFLKAIEKGQVASVVSVTSIYPIITVLLSYIFLKEAITIAQKISIVLAIIAVILSSY